MTLKHPKGSRGRTEDLAVAPLFGLEARTIPRHELPRDELSPDVAYQIIHDELMLDGNARLNVATFVTTWMEPQADEADGRVRRQEHDRQGRVPADGGARVALRGHAQPPVARAGRRGGDRLLDHRVERGGDARRARAQAPLAAAARRPRASPPTGRISSWASTSRCAGRSSPTTGTWRCAWSRWRATGSTCPPRRRSRAATRTRSGSSPILGSTFDGSYEPVKEICEALDAFQARDRHRRPRPRRRRLRRVRRAVRRSGPGLGLPAAARRLDQRLGPQVRARVPGRRLGRLAGRRGAARGPDLLGQLPGRQHADLRAQLLAAGRPGRGPVLQLPPPRLRRLPAACRGTPATSRPACPGGSPSSGPSSCSPRATSCRCSRSSCGTRWTTSRSSTSRTRCASVAGRCPRTRFPKNREDLAALRVVVRRGFTHDLADLLVSDLKRQLPRLQKQPAPVHDGATASGFHH